MSRLGDIVTMPLPSQWGPTVLPAGAVSPIGAAQAGWGRVAGGWVWGSMINGVFYPAPGAPIVQSVPTQPADVSAYFGGTLGTNPSQPANQYPGAYAGGDISTSQPPAAGSGASVPGNLTSASPSVVTPGKGSGPAWSRQSLMPDSILPPVLQRTNPLLRQISYAANYWDQRIKKRASIWSWIAEHGGMTKCCRLPQLGAPIYDQPPWMTMPSQAEKLEQMFSQPISVFQDSGGAFTGVDVVLGQFVVDNGYDGTINRFVTNFNGTGFQDFSGSIVWRLQVNNRFARNLGNVQNTFGDFKTAFVVPGADNIRLVSQQTVTVLANIPVGSPVSGPGWVTAGVFGWMYPRR